MKMNKDFIHQLELLTELAEKLPATVADCGVRVQKGVREFTEKVEALGWTRIGVGFFSCVYCHSDHLDLVVKVGFKKEDSGAAYAAFCRDNKELVGLPEILYTARLQECYLVVMPCYAPLIDSESKVVNELSNLFYLVSDIINRGVQSFERYSDVDVDAECGIIYTAKRIREYFYGLACFDLHQENVMVDNQGKLVITDPVSYTQGLPRSKPELGRNWGIPFDVEYSL